MIMHNISEHAEQCAVIRWWRDYSALLHYDERLLLAIPNGGYRAPVTARRLRDEGVRAGTPDLFLAIPRPPYAGAWIELKRTHGGRLAPIQRRMISILAARGYYCAVCCGADAAINTIMQYLQQSLAT